MFNLTPTVKNLLIINVVVFIMQSFMKDLHLSELLAMYRINSIFFEPYQIFTYMFAHADFFHILFNMLFLVFLGSSLEMAWGGKKFLMFYIVTGIGAGFFYAIIGLVQTSGLQSDLQSYRDNPSVETFTIMVDDHRKKLSKLRFNDGSSIYEFLEKYEKNPEALRSKSVDLSREMEEYLVTRYPGRVIGASGAMYGLLMAFGMMFPERQLMLLFPPIPIKAKYFVLILGGMALYSGLKGNPADPVAHLVHLGGMVFGFIMVKFFK